MYRTDQIAQVRELLTQGVPKTAIAQQLRISRRIIYHWLSAGYLDSASELPRSRIFRQRKLGPYLPLIEARLAADATLSTARIFRELKAAGYNGGLTQVRTYVAAKRRSGVATEISREGASE